MMIPGLKVVAPSSPIDVIGLLAASVRDPDPVIFLEHKSLYATKGEVPDGEILDTLGTAKILRPGKDATIIALALMVPRALAAAEKLAAEHGIDCEVIDVRSLVPLDTQTILGSVAKTHRCFSVEENPRLCGWGARSCRSSPTRHFYISTARWCASPRRTARCRGRHSRRRHPADRRSHRRSREAHAASVGVHHGRV